MILKTFLALISASTLMINMLIAQNNDSNRYFNLLVGTYTSGKSEGIYVYEFDTQTGKFAHKYTAKDIENPSFVTTSPDCKNVYAVNELSGDKPGSVSAYKFDAKSGEMTFLNNQPSAGGDPCYLTVDEKKRHLIVGNYTGGNLSVLPIQKDGSLGAPVQTIQHEGSSANKSRQEKAHVHSTVFTPSQDYLFVGDLGTDKVNAYQYQPKDKKQPLKAAEKPFTKIEGGKGPRHIIFSESGDYAYLVLELTAEVGVYKHEKGELKHLQTISMTREDFEGDVGAAEIKFSPDGKFLYASNRGDANEIAIYKVNQTDGTLKLSGIQSTLGKIPRNFLIDPTGKFLLVAHQGSDSIVAFERDKETGLLTATGETLEVGNPVYLKMVPVK